MNRAAACILLLSSTLGCRTAGRRCPQPESFARTRLADWTGTEDLVIGLVARAPASCSGRSYPVIQATHPRADAWLQVVEADSAVFIDVSPADRKRRIPFYSKGKEFWDNPDWGRPKRKLVWEGYAYPVSIRSDGVVPLGGFRWGFQWDPADKSPSPLPVTMVPPSKWAEHAAVLRDKFGGTNFLAPESRH
jgi:hypothetical protein